MKHLHLLLAALAGLLAIVSCKKNEEKDKESLPKEAEWTCTAVPPENLGFNCAKLNAEAEVQNPDGTAPRAWFTVATTVDSLASSKTILEAGNVPAEGGSFSAQVTGLDPETTYYFTASIAIGPETLTSEVGSFTTPALVVTARTLEPLFVEEFRVGLHGSVSVNGVLEEDMKGAFRMSAGTPTLEYLQANGTRYPGVINENWETDNTIGNLEYNKAYRYVASFTIRGVEYFGDVVDFTTSDLQDTLTTIGAWDIYSNKVQFRGCLKGHYDESVTVGFLVSPTASDIESLKASGKNVECYYNEDKEFGKDYTAIHGGLHYYAAYAFVGSTSYYGEVKSVNVPGLAEGNPVDMGVSVKWAAYNMGADSPLEDGDYYAWGETSTKSSFSWSNYLWGTAAVQTKYNETDKEYELDPSDDAVHAILGGNWRMPTLSEVQELADSCKKDFSSLEGSKYGLTVTAKNGNMIFFAANSYIDGTNKVTDTYKSYYWISSLLQNDRAWSMYCVPNSYQLSAMVKSRYLGLPIRPVSE